MENCVTVRNLSKKYYLFNQDMRLLQWLLFRTGYTAEKYVLQDVSFDVKCGDVVGIIGKNGAGKSTLMQLIAGVILPTSGTIETSGKIGALINLSAGFEPNFTGRQNIFYKGTLMGMTNKEINDILPAIIDFVELGEYFDMPIRMYSSGMSARLGFALAVFSEPEILIVDEVFAVGDKNFQEKSKAKIAELFGSGKSVLFSSHSDPLIRNFCNKVMYIKDGRIAFEGDVEEGLEMYSDDVARERKRKK